MVNTSPAPFRPAYSRKAVLGWIPSYLLCLVAVCCQIQRNSGKEWQSSIIVKKVLSLFILVGSVQRYQQSEFAAAEEMHFFRVTRGVNSVF